MASTDDLQLPELAPEHSHENVIDTGFTEEISKDTTSTEESTDSCRICRGEASDTQPLFYPCKCSGSIRYVHQECLMEWLSHSKKKYCELCKTPFRFTKLYDTSMPTSIPWHTFVRQLTVHFLWASLRWVRYLTVAIIWLVALPWCIRQVWRGLFWLADGSWVPERQLRLNHTSDTDRVSDAISTESDRILSHAQTAVDDGDQSESIFTSFLRFLAGDSFGAKVLRILFSIPPVQLTSSSEKQNVRNIHARNLPRQPSLLSGVTFVKSWTGSEAANNVSIDVMEGILVCLGLVASFILVFLIREWVINQRPLLNNPDAQEGDNPNAVVDELRAQRALRRARRRRPNGRELPGVAADIVAATGPDNVQVDVDPTLRQRAMTDDNIGVSSGSELSRPDLPARAQSLTSSATLAEASMGDADANGEPFASFPPTLLRGMVGDALDARRALEESTSASGPESDVVATPGSIELATHANVPESESAVEHLSYLPTPPPELNDTATDTGNRRRSMDSMILHLNDDLDEPGTAATASENSRITPSTDDNTDTVLSEVPISSVDAAAEQIIHEQPATLIGRVTDWFWYVEGVPDPDLHQDLPHEQTGAANAQDEAHLVPGGEAALAAAPVAQRPPQLLPEDAVPGFDLNDPNALDDEEDLEGVLELIGMEGPLIGMVQNVVFSLLLISLTLSAAVWIPYIWGKIALILLANPVAVAFKAPIYLLTHFVDLIADICFFLLGLLGLIFNMVAKTIKQATKPIIPAYSNLLDTERFEELAINITHRSGNRLERTLADTITIFNPDLPTFSMQSHRALLSFKASTASIISTIRNVLLAAYDCLFSATWSFSSLPGKLVQSIAQLPQFPTYLSDRGRSVILAFGSLTQPPLEPVSLNSSSAEDVALVQWSAQDKIIAVVLGYLFFALLGLLFMKLAHAILGLKKNEKVDGPIADRLREAGGVVKVIVIIGIEMIVFPLYCGLLLDLALLPLFEGATVQTRLAFIAGAPFTGLFLHWFAGTCYMFHFALFVSMCRKILRKGVLYFIRDPDDPTFHPIRDVLERPVPTQLGKIAFSALVYGGLVIMCLGGVVWSIGQFSTALPVRWTGTQPRLAFPIDVAFFNFLVPFLIRRIRPSEKISAVYEWWFRTVARHLRLSHFLFGEEREDEKHPRLNNGVLSWHRRGQGQPSSPTKPEGTYVRAPASDSCRIPKHQKAFLEVTENNERVDGQHDHKHGLHGSKNENFAKIWLPPQFKPRMATFVVLLWLFAAGTGIACTIGPLILGRRVIKAISGLDDGVNDLYALTIGLHLMGGVVTAVAYAGPVYKWTREKARGALPTRRDVTLRLVRLTQYLLGLVYLAVVFGIILPFTLSLLTELYIHIPLFTFLFDREKFIASAPNSSDANIMAAATTLSESTSTSGYPKKLPPTVYVLQTWTLGLLYLRLAIRTAINYPCPHTRLSTAIRMIVRDGFWHPNVGLATRAVIVPLALSCIVLITVPIGYAKFIVRVGRLSDPTDITRIYRFAYPGTLGLVVLLYALWTLKKRLASWRTMVRDDIYLVGERLHNYASHSVENKDKGKGKVIELSPSATEIAGDAPEMAPAPVDFQDRALIRDW